MNESIREKNGYKYKFVTNKNIEFLPKYKEFDCTFSGKTEKVYLIAVIPNDYDILDDLCLVLPLSWIPKLTPEEKQKPIGISVKGKQIKGYNDFIIPFLPSGL